MNLNNFNVIRNLDTLIIFLFFISLSIIGFLGIGDYGVSIDEIAYKNDAYLQYEFIKNLLFINFSNIDEIYNELHSKSIRLPSFFYILVFLVNDVLKIINISLDLYKISHLVNFTLFISACFCFFKIVENNFNNKLYAYLAVLILFTTPRFFAESFYNNRDIYFLSIYLINLYFIKKLFQNLNYKNILIYSFFAALCINARLFGIINFLIVFIFLLLEYEKKFSIRKFIYFLSLKIILTIIFMILLNPLLWFDPFSNFINYIFTDLNETGTIEVTNLILGQTYSSNNSPWFFYIVWILFTIPLLYIVSILIGLIPKCYFFLKNLFYLSDGKNIWSNKNELFDLFIVVSIFIYIFGMSRFGSVKYDGWRHLYFLYPLMIFNILFMIDYIKKYFFLKNLVIFLFILNIVYNFYWIKKNHPYQYTYFNYLNNIIDVKFDLDYWGLSNYQVFKYLLKITKNTKFTVGTISFNDLMPNYLLLNEKDKKKISFLIPEDRPDYLIDNYRLKYKMRKNDRKFELIQGYKLIYEIKVDGNIISSVYERL